MYFDITIVIISFNKFSVLESCLKSVYKYTNNISFEIIVVDNNSTEGDVEEVVKPYRDLILVKNNENKGFAVANNQVLKRCNGKYILLLNNDTELIENSLEKVFEFAESKNENLFVGCRLLNRDGSNQESIATFPNLVNTLAESFFLYKIFKKSKVFNKYYQNNINVNAPIKTDVVKGAFLLATKESLVNLNGFDERFFFYSEEVDLCKRFKDNCGKIYFYPNTKVYHYEGEGSAANQWFRLKNLSYAKIQYFQKHFTGLNFVLIIIFHFLGLIVRIPYYFFIGLICNNKKELRKSYYFAKTLFIYPKNQFNRNKT